MNKRLSTIFFSFFLCLTLLVTTISDGYAQTLSNTGVVSLADLDRTEIALDGPFDTSTVTFGLPADWKLTGGARIDLNISTAFNVTSQNDVTVAGGGTLIVSFNRVTVATLVLNEVGTFDYVIDVPTELLISPRTDGLMELRFTLDSGISCVANQRMSVVVNATSQTTFQYEDQMPDTALINFPRPLVQSSIFPDLALVIIPDKPTAMELQSAFTVIAGLGNLSSNNLGINLIRASELTETQKAGTHIIFVGNAGNLPALADLPLSLKSQNGSFVFAEEDKDNGFIQMINSPWAVKNVILIVSGNTDLGTLNAAQAVSTGVFQQNISPNLAIVENIQDSSIPVPLVTDQTFGDLGYTTEQYTNRGVDSQTYNFYIPAGSTLSTDAYLELAFGHSALLDFNVSGMVILLNNQPIGSAKFSDISAGQAINRIRIAIPPSVAIPGDNRIEIRTNLEPLDNCADPNLRGLWAVVWPDSRLHLLFTPVQLNTELNLDLSAYPAPMIFDSTLETTAIVFQRDDFESWHTFAQVASFLGDRSNGSITKLGVFFDDDLSEIELSQYNLIVIGRPSQLAIMDELNPVLPVPFENGTDITQGKFLQVTYQVPPEIPIGYMELMPSPWNKEKVLIAAFGNTVTGVNWSISSLADSLLRSQLAGDFAVINDTRVQTIDTRLVVPVANTPIAQDPSEIILPPQSQENLNQPSSRPSWLLPALILAILLTVIVIAIVIFTSFRSARKSN